MADDDTFKILLSTDNHLGFLEKDLIRGNDSFVTFEEILSIAEGVKPDFVLLAGDLFHENKPSISSLFKCTELLRKYALNENAVRFQIVSDQSANFAHSQVFQHSNFNDANINVGMPIFTIHGNHDDPIDQTNLCALDLFHASGLVNLFGKSSSVETINIQPILMVKGTTKIALYGLGAIRNERLHRLFQQKKVQFLRPSETPEEWFSIFALHQNRVKHGATNYIPENFLPDFLDLVIWGHEHDCRIDPEYNTSQEFYLSQPGSSVATSLCEGESQKKHIGMLTVCGKDFKIDKIRLQTVRPFVIGTVVLEDEDSLVKTDPKIVGKIERLCEEKLDSLLLDVDGQLTGHAQQPQLPLVRLSVDYSGGFEMLSATRFCQKYVAKVANPKDMLVLHRKREQTNKDPSKGAPGFVLSVPNVKNDCGLDGSRVEDLVRQHFVAQGDKLRVLNEKELGIGVKLSVDKNDKDILDRVVDMQIERVETHLKRKQVHEQLILDEIERYVDLLDSARGDDDEEDYIRERLRAVPARPPTVCPSVSMSAVAVALMADKDNAKPGRKPRKKQTDAAAAVKSENMELSLHSSACKTEFTAIGESFRKRKTKAGSSCVNGDDEWTPSKRKY